ncbi:unnamed protein product, partial [Didymodactylos carnosus]
MTDGINQTFSRLSLNEQPSIPTLHRRSIHIVEVIMPTEHQPPAADQDNQSTE